MIAAAVIASTACDGGAKVATPPTTSTTTADSQRAIDPQLVGRCVATYSCGMSHPGLGSYSNARIVDLATCTRTVTRDNGPWEGEAQHNDAQAGEHTRHTEALTPGQCAEIAKLLAAITVADAAAAQESAQHDTQACGLDVSCPQGGPSKLRIQRQTTSGASRVEQLLRAL